MIDGMAQSSVTHPVLQLCNKSSSANFVIDSRLVSASR